MKILFVFLLFLGGIINIFAQNCGLVEKDMINKMKLFKAYSQYSEEGTKLIANHIIEIEGETYYYFDEEMNLRKFILWNEYPESLGVIIAYYSKNKELMYIIFNNFQPEGYSYSGIAQKTHCGSDTIDFRYQLQYSNMADFENSIVSGNSNRYPVITSDWDILSKYSHVDSLKAFMQIEMLQPPHGCKKVVFSKPSKHQTTFTNSNNVNIRERANTSSKVITSLHIGRKLEILDVLHEETVKNLGNYNWYKIKVNQIEGYIFGAFLEPIEKEILK